VVGRVGIDGRSQKDRAGVHPEGAEVAVIASTDGVSNVRIYVLGGGVSRVLPGKMLPGGDADERNGNKTKDENLPRFHESWLPAPAVWVVRGEKKGYLPVKDPGFVGHGSDAEG